MTDQEDSETAAAPVETEVATGHLKTVAAVANVVEHCTVGQ